MYSCKHILLNLIMRIYFTSILNFIYSKTTVLIFLTSLFSTIYMNFNSNNCENVIRADGLGYYSYLPAIFIYNDYQFSFIDDIKKSHPQINFGDGFLNKTDIFKEKKTLPIK